MGSVFVSPIFVYGNGSGMVQCPCPSFFYSSSTNLFGGRGLIRLLIVSFVLLLCCGCQKFELDNSEAGEPSAPVFPIGHGRGTQQYPLTVADIKAGKVDSGQLCWVMGYAVGTTYRSMSNALFTVPTEWSQNILLSDDSLCIDAAGCIAVQLTTQEMKNTFSLYACPDMHGQAVVLYGVIGKYLYQLGVSEANDGYWLPGFDLNEVNVQPTPWDEYESKY